MAHFAELDDTNTVVRVVVINDNDCRDASGIEREEIGAVYCANLFGGGLWLQTSYNGKIRGRFAGVGFKYDAATDKFVQPD